MPIPRCDEAVGNTFGGSKYRWLMDAISGYNQIRVAKSSRPKLAFAGPDCSKFTWLVMPFGPVNGPVIFIVFIHDLDSTWKDITRSRGILINSHTNTTIIVDDLFSWAPTFDEAIAYLTCQLDVCLSQNLSLSLKKSFFFPHRMEFVGVDVCDDGNRPAMSKHELVKHWPAFVTVRDVSSFVGFMNFYANWIPLFAQRISPLRSIITKSMDDTIGALTDEQSTARTDMISAICDDPVIARYDYTKRPYLLTDFSKKGFGYVICQPGDDPDALAAMRREMDGDNCEFLTKGTKLIL